MKTIKIFVCCHKFYDILPPLCEPIQCGSAFIYKIKGIIHDEDGTASLPHTISRGKILRRTITGFIIIDGFWLPKEAKKDLISQKESF